ncbi:MAG: molybdopterin cofactor-binding domain-containing protein [Sphingopyxis sp.]
MSRSDNIRDSVNQGGGRFLPTRRGLLIGGGAVTGLVLAWAAWPRTQGVPATAAPGEHIFGPYIKIGTDGHITVMVPQLEMGQGIFTLIAQLVADEMGADWRTISVEPAPVAGAYASNRMLGRDMALVTPRWGIPEGLATIGSWRLFSVGSGAAAMMTDEAVVLSDFEQPVRESAALARAMLSMAAAAQWDTDWELCGAADGFITHGERRLRFGELAASAAQFDPPNYPPLRAPGTGHLYGQSAPRIDLASKIDGSLAFAGDIRLPDMVYAAIRQGPIGDTRLKHYDRAAADDVTGFLAAVKHDRWLAAVATNSWAARLALDAMAPIFTTYGQRADSDLIDRRLNAAIAAADGARIIDEGSVADAFEGRAILGAEYAVAPALHAAIETRTATAAPDGNRIQLWVASQAPGACRAAVAAALGVSEAHIIVFSMPAGGSFGGAMDHDVAVQAALIAKEMNRPVQLIWSRTEEILRDNPRAPARARLRASLSSGSTIDGWHAAIATPASRHEWRARVMGASADQAMASAAGALDAAAIAGARPPYTIPNLAIEHLPAEVALPAGRLRGGANGFTTFFTECFVDELARAAGADPLSFRMGMLGSEPLLARCLQGAAELGGWDGGQAGSGHGLACATVDDSHIGLLAIARSGTSGLIVERLVAVVDVGRALNPNVVRQQVEGGLVFGLAMAVGATTRYRAGLARARQLRNLGLPTLAQTPEISVEIIPSDRDAGGIGQLGVLPVAPAIANALFTVSGERIRRLPLSAKAVT